LVDVTQRLAAMVFMESEEAQRQGREARMKLSLRKEELEREVAKHSAAYRGLREREQMTPVRLQAALPPDTALVDFFEYAHLTPPKKTGGKVTSERRLAAFVVHNGRPITRLDLGPMAPITNVVESWRRTFGGKIPADELRRLVWQPLEPHLKGARVVLIG